ncbi:hypothetical protein F5888DRAFT_1826570 [Russula emetica]|nr:hypothetical protein F5888DRAFT_1826570 [Russula emetica]
MSSPSPPPPYSLQPPPYTRRQRKPLREPSPPRPPRVSSRELLTEALKCAQRAVKLDSANTDLPLAVAAYGEAIAILQRVIARRSQKPGVMSDAERVTSIHDRYADRVRELCRIHKIPLPSHVAPTPGGFTPSMITSPLPPLDPPQDPSPDTPLVTHDTNPSPKFQHQSSSNDDETESESEPQLSRSPSTAPSTSETPLRTPADDYVFEGRQWMIISGS